MNSDGGFTRLYRRLWTHPAFRNKQEAAVFAWMVSAAQWRHGRISTKFGPVDLLAGEVIIAERPLTEDFGLHRNTLRALIQRLVDEGTIAVFRDRCPARAGTIVRVLKYKQYQGFEYASSEGEDRKRTANGTEAGPLKDRLRTKNNEVNEGKTSTSLLNPQILERPPESGGRAGGDQGGGDKVASLPHPLPADWQPGAADLAWARAAYPHVGLELATERFLSHWRDPDQPARQRTKRGNWGTQWRSWVERIQGDACWQHRRAEAVTGSVTPDELWRGRVKSWLTTGIWNASVNGPEPDQPGTRVPADLVAWAKAVQDDPEQLRALKRPASGMSREVCP